MTEIPNIYEFLRDAKGVIHVGASYGQEREIYATLNLPVIWIEPIPEVFKELVENIKPFENQTALNNLISGEDGKVYAFHLTNNSFSSSVLPLKYHLDVWPDVKETEKYSQTSRTLDSLFKNYDLSQFDTLILDVQGMELEVLKGAKTLLNNLRFIRCEASSIELYENQALDHQLARWMSQHGFEFKQRWDDPNFTEFLVSEILFESSRSKKNCRILDPKTGIEHLVKIGVVTSNPRLGFQVHASVVFQAFGKTGWPIGRVSGAFWEQSMQNGLNVLIDQFGCDYIIALDYDSIFDKEDVEQLILMAVRYPEADCLAAWQMKRHVGKPTALVGWLNEDKTGFIEELPRERLLIEEITEVDHTVFGLTLLKVEALKKVIKPWFQSFPNKDGEWLEGKTDADAYFFRKWKESGNSIYMVNSIKIGHLEEVILGIDDDFMPYMQPLITYHQQGRTR